MGDSIPEKVRQAFEAETARVVAEVRAGERNPSGEVGGFKFALADNGDDRREVVEMSLEVWAATITAAAQAGAYLAAEVVARMAAHAAGWNLAEQAPDAADEQG